jgi:hypothetical protein
MISSSGVHLMNVNTDTDKNEDMISAKSTADRKTSGLAHVWIR